LKATEIIRRYVDAWNSHDATALVAAFTKDGTYCSPHTYPGLNMDGFAEFAETVWTSFPDLQVKLLNVGEIEAGVGATHWIVTGTNTGPGMDGSEPTGRPVSFNGASIIQIEGDKLRSENAYFDPKIMEGQLARK